jgi:hypothetical protein
MDKDEVEASMTLIPLLWAAKMLMANMEFIADLKASGIDERLETVLRERTKTPH